MNYLLLILLFIVSLFGSKTTIFAATIPCVSNCPTLSPGTLSGDWPMVAGNLERTSWNTENVPGMLYPEWYTVIDANIPREAQIIAANNALYVSTDKGLAALNAATGAKLWTFGTSMPLGNSPTFANGYVYAGGYDRKIYAINASDGKLKTGWTFVEATAGFETNPLIIDNRLYAGSRDGYMYCLDANTGALLWKWRDDSDEFANAPIRFTPAYKNGVLYWGADNAHVYALRVNSGSPQLVWKSKQLPGVGFNTYWASIYHDKNLNKDFVILSGSKKESSFVWWNANEDNYYYQENYEIFPGVPLGTFVGSQSTVTGDWVNGTTAIDATKIQQYFNNKPHKRHLSILYTDSGDEFTPYAPVNWAATTHGGDKFPPIISGIDGVIYTFIGYQYGPDNNTYPNMGASGCLAGWKFGTQYISRICDFSRGFADETVQFTAGGNLAYWVEGFNMPYGSIELNKPFSTNTQIDYAPCAGDCLGVPNHGGDGPLTPYKGKLYMFDGNAIIALGQNNTKTAMPTITIATPTVSHTSVLQTNMLKNMLESEVQKIISAGVLRPGYHDSGIWGSYANGAYSPFGDYPYITGDHIAEYFHTPSETIAALYWALPFVSSTTASQIKTYVKNNYGPGKPYDVTTIAHVGWKNGAQREIFLDTPEINEVGKRSYEDMNLTIASAPRTVSQYPTGYLTKIWNFPQDAFYGAWKYAQMHPTEATAVFNAIKGKLESPAISNADLIKFPYILNQFINGYIGYIELGTLAGANVSSAQTTLTNLVNLRMNNFSQTFTEGSYENVLRRSKNFMFMTPELADLFKSRAKPSATAALTNYLNANPYWFVTKYESVSGEGVFQTLYEYHALFQAKAMIADATFDELTRYLDVPAFWRGDLYYLQNLTSLLAKSTSTPQKPGDANGDNLVNSTDFDIWKLNYDQAKTGSLYGDFNNNGKVNGMDFVIWLQNFGQ